MHRRIGTLFLLDPEGREVLKIAPSLLATSSTKSRALIGRKIMRFDWKIYSQSYSSSLSLLAPQSLAVLPYTVLDAPDTFNERCLCPICAKVLERVSEIHVFHFKLTQPLYLMGLALVQYSRTREHF